jgi:putative transposase
MHENTLYAWKKRFGGLGTPGIRELRQLGKENEKLKRLVADLSLDKTMLQDIISKNSCEAGAAALALRLPKDQ